MVNWSVLVASQVEWFFVEIGEIPIFFDFSLEAPTTPHRPWQSLWQQGPLIYEIFLLLQDIIFCKILRIFIVQNKFVGERRCAGSNHKNYFAQ